ncbi:MAG TPA: FtsX-like permease family protein, partial [Gammaproteobacteria bacterium]
DSKPGAVPVIILGHELWLNRYLGDPGIIGRTIRVNAHPATVIGVMPPGFAFPYMQDAWLPITLDAESNDYENTIDLDIFARLPAGSGIGAMRDALAAMLVHHEQDLPVDMRELVPRVIPYAEEFINPFTKHIVGTLSVCVLFVLFIACVNVASLMIARSIRYQRETAIRGALGASRRRLAASVLFESLLVAMVAAGIGMMLSHWGGNVLDRYLIAVDDMPVYWAVASYDWRMLLFVTGLVFLVAVTAGLAPALRAGRADLTRDLKQGGATTGGSASRTLRSLVWVEIGLSCILLVTTGLMLRSMFNAINVDVGADTRNVLTGRVGLFEERYPDFDTRHRFVRQLEDELLAIPGVENATVATGLPVAVSGDTSVYPEGVDNPAETFNGNWSRYVAVTPAYFELFDITLRQGRFFSINDDADHPDVAVVTQRFVNEYLPQGNPLGRRIRLDGGADWVTIIGVTGNVVQDSDDLNDPPQPVLYRPVAQSDHRFFSFAVRSAGNPQALQDEVRAAVLAVDPDMPVYWLRTLEDWMLIGTSSQHLLAALLGVCTFFAILLSGIGLYAVLAYSVNQRVREIGVRRALGADDPGIALLLLRENVLPLCSAVLLGLVLAAGFARLFATEFVGVSSFDPLTYLAVVALLALLISLASFFPARRALRIQPQEALHYE